MPIKIERLDILPIFARRNFRPVKQIIFNAYKISYPDIYQDLRKMRALLRSGTDYTLFFISLFAFGIAVWDTGFPQSEKTQQILISSIKSILPATACFISAAICFYSGIVSLSVVAITNLLLGAVLLFEYSLSLILGKPYILGSFFHLSSGIQDPHCLVVHF